MSRIFTLKTVSLCSLRRLLRCIHTVLHVGLDRQLRGPPRSAWKQMTSSRSVYIALVLGHAESPVQRFRNRRRWYPLTTELRPLDTLRRVKPSAPLFVWGWPVDFTLVAAYGRGGARDEYQYRYFIVFITF